MKKTRKRSQQLHHSWVSWVYIQTFFKLFIFITSAFMEYWGRAWADYCDISYIASSASVISALLVYSVQVYIHKQHAGTLASSVSRLCRYEHHKTARTVSPSVVSDSQRRVGKLMSSYSSTVSVGWICLYHVSAQSPTCLRRPKSQQSETQVGPLLFTVQCMQL